MDVIHPRCAGLDISKKDAKVCVRVAGSGRARATQTVTTWGATTNQILALREHLVAEKVTCVVMEATGDYWKPFYYLLEDLEAVEVMLVNARDAKNLPGWPTSPGCGYGTRHRSWSRPCTDGSASTTRSSHAPTWT